MAKAFRRTKSGIAVNLSEGERSILASAFTDTAQLLAPETDASEDPLTALVGITEDAELPADPALARLLPDGRRDSAEDADEFRRYTERGLRERKIANIQTAVFTLKRSDPLVLAEPEAQAWVVALGDVRLVVAQRLGIETEADLDALEELNEAEEDDPRGMIMAVYDFLSWLQESLVGVLLASLPDDKD
ncbi:DUF2017 domain-containing protein [Saxibacter everestensis]|uniref:DUF2017 domain-containing protein n=1 Tax=Saxibacter everestensis TaxID=2909229 RepID=A0ABY8QPB3_9MICO|nr:DUF2017 domain-containing protein [Brevibacteriaceae bacterium ZFBP1038]